MGSIHPAQTIPGNPETQGLRPTSDLQNQRLQLNHPLVGAAQATCLVPAPKGSAHHCTREGWWILHLHNCSPDHAAVCMQRRPSALAQQGFHSQALWHLGVPTQSTTQRGGTCHPATGLRRMGKNRVKAPTGRLLVP